MDQLELANDDGKEPISVPDLVTSSARTSPASNAAFFPPLTLPDGEFKRQSDLFEMYASTKVLGTYEQVHYERLKVTAALFSAHFQVGAEIVELGDTSLVGGFAKDCHSCDYSVWTENLDLKIGLESASKDIVICLELISELRDISDSPSVGFSRSYFDHSGVKYLFSEAFRVLKPGGRLLLSAPNATSVDSLIRILRQEHPYLYEPHIREFAPIQIKSFGEGAGFRFAAFGTFFAWGTASEDERAELLKMIGDLGYSAADRGDDACYVFTKPSSILSDGSFGTLNAALLEIPSLSGIGAAATAKLWRERHQAGLVPDYENLLADVFSEFLKPGDTVVDVGVNMGRHFTRFRSLVGETGQVIGFEPVPDFAAHSRALVGQDSEIREKALSDAPGIGEFLFMTKAVGESGFVERTSDGDRGAKPIQVEISTLDAELQNLDHLKYIKIDTEGHELSVLKGGLDILRRFRPFVSVEWGEPTYALYGHDKSSLYDFARSNGYLVSDLFGNIVAGHCEWDLVSDQSYWDFFLIPEEKRDEWTALFRFAASKASSSDARNPCLGHI